VHFKRTGEVLAPADYEEPRFDLPTIRVATDGGYAPELDKIAMWIRSTDRN